MRPRNLCIGVALLLATAHCSSNASNGTSTGAGSVAIPRIDQLAWYAQLQAGRPDLVTDISPLGACWQALTLKPEYRSRLLSGTETPAQIVQAEYTSAEQATDAAWATSLQDAELAFCEANDTGGCSRVCAGGAGSCAACADEGTLPPFDAGWTPLYYASGYGLCSYVGYQEGPDTSVYDSRGYDWKLLFQLSDYVSGLTPDAYQQLSQALGAAGYQGDSKTSTSSGFVRFRYNTLIVHAHSRSDAAIAERVVVSTLGPWLVGYSRGTDVYTAQTGTATDWHDYLCQVRGDVSQLPPDVLSFIQFAD